jgi:hypothetical protein
MITFQQFMATFPDKVAGRTYLTMSRWPDDACTLAGFVRHAVNEKALSARVTDSARRSDSEASASSDASVSCHSDSEDDRIRGETPCLKKACKNYELKTSAHFLEQKCKSVTRPQAEAEGKRWSA